VTPIVVPVAPDHPAFAGHFPGQPLLPGVCLLGLVLDACLADADLAPRLYAGAGAPLRLANVKFLAPVRPGDTLLLHWQLRAEATPMRLGFEVGRRSGAPSGPDDVDTVLAVSGLFELVAPSATAVARLGDAA
jgi:hypothetical protein